MSKRISMWSGPRNISTTLMYSFRSRTDTTVIDEPLYAHYLSKTPVKHPGDDEVLAAMENDGQRVIDEVILGNYAKPVVFFKNMAHHLTGLDTAFLRELDNILLTRHPKAMLASLVKQLPEPCLRDTGLKQLSEVLELILSQGQTPLVLESAEVLKNPRAVLQKLCHALKIDFQESMLSWPAGPKPEDGMWAKYWYSTVHQSTGFIKPEDKEINLPERLEPLLEECLPYYETLSKYALKAEGITD